MSQDSPSIETPVPSRTLGFMMMSAVIVAVALFLAQHREQHDADEQTPAFSMPANLPGFSAEHWYLPDDSALGFVHIPAGRFTMGSNPAVDPMAYGNERWSATRRQGRPELPSYYIARYETSVAQFSAYLNATGQSSSGVEGLAPDLPITGITWPEALAYTRWLDLVLRQSDQTPAELRAFLEGGGRVTLPSEAEWEKAARGTEGQVFPWRSGPPPESVNFNGGEIRAVNAVDCSECVWGLSDMSGNVWEMTASPMQPYPYSEADDLEARDGEALWVMRGGSFADGLGNIRAAVRGGVDPGVRNEAIGFRLVISARLSARNP